MNVCVSDGPCLWQAGVGTNVSEWVYNYITVWVWRCVKN